jgi:hypothetical protein
MTIAKGVSKKLIIAEQAALGTIAAVNAATAAYMRRVTSTVDLSKDTYESNEKRTDMQIADMRHGAKSVGGAINGELSPGSYQMLMAAVMRRAWTDGVSDGPNDDVTAAATTGAAGTFTRHDMTESSAESERQDWLTDGFKVGDVIRMTGWTSPATANNNHNFLITALTTTVMTVVGLDGVPPVAKAAGDPVVTSVVGKKTFLPTSGHTNKYFTIEHYYSDIDLSEVFTDCKFSSMDIKLPPSGMGTIDFNVVGLDMTPHDTADAPYFSAPSAMNENGILAAVNGVLYAQGAAVALLTGLDFSLSGDASVADPVVGSNSRPDVFDGKLKVSGNMTVYFTSATFRDYFRNETEVSLFGAFTTSDDADADFLAFCMPRIKAGGASKDDNDKGLVQTIPFTALLNTTGGTGINSEETTLSVQDSTL